MVPRMRTADISLNNNNNNNNNNNRGISRHSSIISNNNGNNNLPKRKKSVRFAPDSKLCDYRKGMKTMTETMINDMWFQVEEFDCFRSEARDASMNAVKKGLSAYIKHTYGYNDDKTQEMLNLWARCSDTRRGLERFINEDYGKSRKRHQKKTVQAVLYAQERLRADNERDYNRSSAVISNVASTLSKDAVEFASMLGKADYAAVIRRRVTVVRRVPSINRQRRVPAAAAAAAAAQERLKTRSNSISGSGNSTITITTTSSGSSGGSSDVDGGYHDTTRPPIVRPPFGRSRALPPRPSKKAASTITDNNIAPSEDGSDSSDFSDTVPVIAQSPEQKREKREKRDQRDLLERANLGRREISFVQQR